MSVLLHTPTPWAWHKGDDERDVNGSVYREARKGQAYAIAMQPRYVGHEQWAADAAFIVTACNAYDAMEAALKDAYALYLSRVDYRDRLKPDDPDRRYAQACVEASGEMYFLIRNKVNPGEPGSPTS